MRTPARKSGDKTMCSKCENHPQSGADTIEAREAAIEAEYNAAHPAYWQKRAQRMIEAAQRSEDAAQHCEKHGDAATAAIWRDIAAGERDTAAVMLRYANAL